MKYIKRVHVYPSAEELFTVNDLEGFIGHETIDGGVIVGILDYGPKGAILKVEFETRPVAKGVWFVFGHDNQPYPIGIHNNELDATKDALQHYGSVIFWPFGKEWDEVKP